MRSLVSEWDAEEASINFSRQSSVGREDSEKEGFLRPCTSSASPIIANPAGSCSTSAALTCAWPGTREEGFI